MPQTTHASLQESFVTALANQTLLALREKPKIANFITNVDSVDKGRSFTQGNTCNIVLDPTFTATDAVDGSGKTYQRATQNKISITLDHFKEVPAVYTDLDSVIANPSLTIQRYAPRMADALSEVMEKTILLEALNDADVPAGNEVGDANNAIDEDVFLELDEKFAEAGISDAEDKIVFLTPRHYRQALKIARLTQNDTSGAGDAIRTAKLRDAYGLSIYRSTYLPTSTALDNVTGTGTNKVSMAFTKQSLLLATRALSQTNFGGVPKKTVSKDGYSLRVKMFEDGDKNEYRIVADVLFGTKVVKRPSSNGDQVTVFPILGGTA